MHDFNLNIEHVTRVEGHGNIVIDVKEGRIKELKLEIVESPRFFEAMTLGRAYHEIPHITSRICGICAVTHTLSSIKAIEAALKFKPSDQTIILRKLMLHAETIQSHILHIYFLALPDFFGKGSVFELVPDKKEVVLRGMRLKKLANDICSVVGGRHIHPITLAIGYLTHLPSKDELEELRDRLKNARVDMEKTIELLKELKVPDFERQAEYLSLSHLEEYAFYDGDIVSSDGGKVEPDRYLEKVKEFIVSHSTAKHAKSRRPSYMVGALARINNNYKQLNQKAKDAAKFLGINPPCYNPFMNNAAQGVEVVHCVEDAISLLDGLIKKGLKEEKPKIKIKAGRGVGATEAPRGTLYHEHILDESGCVEKANYIIPTAQNLENIENDLYELVPKILDRPKEEVILNLEMLVRAYDPCISCSTHMLEVEFK